MVNYYKYDIVTKVKNIKGNKMSSYDVVKTTRKVNSQDGTTTTAADQGQAQTTVEYQHVTYTRNLDAADFLCIALVIIVLIAGIIGFINALRSRKRYKCPVCGESFRVENMDANTCKVCGAKVEKTFDENITDKTV